MNFFFLTIFIYKLKIVILLLKLLASSICITCKDLSREFFIIIIKATESEKIEEEKQKQTGLGNFKKVLHIEAVELFRVGFL